MQTKLTIRLDSAVISRAKRIAKKRGDYVGLICATSVTTVVYISARIVSTEQARGLSERMLSLFRPAAVTGAVLLDALRLDFTDFEDAVLYQSAISSGADGIVTRD